MCDINDSSALNCGQSDATDVKLTWETVQVVVAWLDGISVCSHIPTAEVLTPPLVCGKNKK